MDFFSNMGVIDWTNEQSIVEIAIDRSRILVGSKHLFDEGKVNILAKKNLTEVTIWPAWGITSY